MQHIAGNLIVSQWPIMNGLPQNPALNFSGGNMSGVAYTSPNNVNFHAVTNTPLIAHANGITITQTCGATKFSGNGSQLTFVPPLAISNVQIADSNAVPLDDTALDSNNVSYLVINGRGFAPGSYVSIGNTLATTVTTYSTQKLLAQIPPKSIGTYDVNVIRPDGVTGSLPMSVSFSPFPIWTTASSLANVTKTIAFSQSLTASESSNANITYALAFGSSLPPNVTLSNAGILSGNITTDPYSTTTYSFTVDAIDAQFQNIPRTFGLTAVSPITITGGTITDVGSYRFHTFTTSGSFTVNANLTSYVLVVAGGGGGGGHVGGGGGGGEIKEGNAVILSPGTYTVVIGGGGSGGPATSESGGGSNGGNSSFGILYTSVGGGGGANVYDAGRAGGSGGGGGGNGGSSTASNGGYGNVGGPGGGFVQGLWACGGGGGAGASGGAGNRADGSGGGLGGNGRQWAINGTYYAGGGGGGWNVVKTSGTAGLGGGGDPGNPGQANTGGGGGGAYNPGGTQPAGPNGGSGIVIVAYVRP